MGAIERVARWSVAHRWRVLAAWVVLVALAALAASATGTRGIDPIDGLVGDSGTAQRMLERAGMLDGPGEVVLVTAGGAPVDGPSGDRLVAELATAARAADGVAAVVTDGDGFVAADGEARFLGIAIDDVDADAVDGNVAELRAAIADVAPPAGWQVRQFGDVSLDADIGEMVGEDLARSELLTLPVTLAILVVTFGAVVAAGLPLLVGLVSVFATISVGALVSHVVPHSDFAPNLVTMLGIALGIDYTLFLLRREREERAAGRSGPDSIGRAAATSGHAVLVSGVVVAVAMCGLLVSGDTMFASMGVNAMLVVAVVVATALLVVPALLGVLGRGVDRGRVPLLGRRRSRRSAWEPVARLAVRRPRTVVVVVVALLVLASLPALQMRTGDASLDSYPRTQPAVAAAAAFQRHFPGGIEPAVVVVHRDGDGTSARALDRAIGELEEGAIAAGVATGAASSTTSTDGRTVEIEVPITGFDSRADADEAVGTLRELADRSIGALDGVTVAVGGSDAESLDFARLMRDRLPVVLAVVLGSSFVLLAIAFRSIVLPGVAIGLNLLSVGAAYGFLVWGFQRGGLEPFLGVAGGGTIVPWMPLFLFTLLFGLSMDYHVFMVSRIRERHLAGASMRDAIVGGVGSSASTITSAALIMVGVFAAFAMSRLAEMQQMGAGLAFAILLDATIVRGLLLPATLGVLGERTWYRPGWMRTGPRRVPEAEARLAPAAR